MAPCLDSTCARYEPSPKLVSRRRHDADSTVPPTETRKHAVTQALVDASQGNQEAAELLWELTYEEMRRIAYRQLQSERSDHTLSGTDLVHEAFIRLVDQEKIAWRDRAHFFGVASQACRRVLIDHARKRHAKKRGGKQVRITVDRAGLQSETPSEDILALDEALSRLNGMDERLAKVVELRYFGGLAEKEVAEVMDMSVRTVRRDWVKARAWLHRELRADGQAT